MSPKAKRLSIIAVIAALVGIAAMLVLGALRDNIVFFYTPTEISVRYDNALPSLFREGQGVVAEGSLANGAFIATNVLAKHDENYMPAEVADKLKDTGVWKGGKTD